MIKLSHTVPFLPIDNLEATRTYYKDVLGFSEFWEWGDPPDVISVRRDTVTLLFSLEPGAKVTKPHLEIMVFLNGVEEIYEEVKDKAEIVSPLEKKPRV